MNAILEYKYLIWDTVYFGKKDRVTEELNELSKKGWYIRNCNQEGNSFWVLMEKVVGHD